MVRLGTMSGPRPHDDLWQEVDRLLERRPGWTFQAMATPGEPPAWCYAAGAERDLMVSVDGGSIRVYVVEADLEVDLATTDDLVAWLATHWKGALGDQRPGVGERLKGGRLFQWE